MTESHSTTGGRTLDRHASERRTKKPAARCIAAGASCTQKEKRWELPTHRLNVRGATRFQYDAEPALIVGHVESLKATTAAETAIAGLIENLG
jgi:hypothetical protein